MASGGGQASELAQTAALQFNSGQYQQSLGAWHHTQSIHTQSGLLHHVPEGGRLQLRRSRARLERVRLERRHLGAHMHHLVE